MPRAAIKAMKDGHHGYTPANGIPALREAVAADIARRQDIEVDPDLIMIMPGVQNPHCSACSFQNAS